MRQLKGQGMAADATIRRMITADIPAGLRLCDLAGWNQVERDWRRFLEFEPEGCFVAEQEGRVLATVTTLRYQDRFGWLGMLLTDPGVRRQGLATRLLKQGCTYLENSGLETVKLDGTPMGRDLYLRHGFVDEYEIQRWAMTAPARACDPLPLLTPGEIEKVCAVDQRVFGADRSALLNGLWNENPSLSALIAEGGEIAGYIFGREGSRALYVGPWAAVSQTSAERLIRTLLARFAGREVFVDLCLKNPAAVPTAKELGFGFQRSLSRMYRGPNSYPGIPEMVYGIAGPELG